MGFLRKGVVLLLQDLRRHHTKKSYRYDAAEKRAEESWEMKHGIQTLRGKECEGVLGILLLIKRANPRESNCLSKRVLDSRGCFCALLRS